jgi:glycosyl transferase family 2
VTLLSICIPTRNRQTYAADAIRHLLQSERQDFEVVVADNSDDPAPLAELAVSLGDPRLKLLPPAAAPLSMRDNWERIIAETSGAWLSYIGDDDYLDPELCEVIRLARSVAPKMDCLSWGRAYYAWPEIRKGDEITTLPVSSSLATFEKKDLLKRLFFWEKSTDRPTCPFGIYHGVVSRPLMEQIRQTFSERYFEQGNLDYDNICKVVMLAECCVLWERPLSVFGACGASNTMALRDRSLAAERTQQFLAENPEGVLADGFPFGPELGITASIAHTIERFKQKYGIDLSGWEDNFIAACAKDCETSFNRAEFNGRKDAYSAAIGAWRGKAAKKQFKPEYRFRPDVPPFIGVTEGKLYFDMNMGETKTAAEFYEMIDAMLFPVNLLEARLL